LKICGEYQEAKGLFIEASEKYRNIYGDKSEKYIIAMQNLGTLYRDKKEYDKALNIFDEILTLINSSSNGSNSSDQNNNTENKTENKKIVSANVEANILNAASGNKFFLNV